jgi:hypothetical protein
MRRKRCANSSEQAAVNKKMEWNMTLSDARMAGSFVAGDALGGSGEKQWYFNTVAGKAEFGPLSPIDQRMGPYASKEDAERAWDIVKERNAKWERQDRVWNNDDRG